MWKNWAIGLICVIAAISGALWYWLDGNPDTKPDVKATVEQVKEGVNIIQNGVSEKQEEQK